MRWIEDQRLPLRGVVLSPDSWDEDFASLVQRCRQLRPGTPIHALIERDDSSSGAIGDSTIQQKLGLREPVRLSELDQFIRTRTGTDTSSRGVRDPMLMEGTFIGVPLSDFQDCDRILFDLHLKLSAGKFLRLIDANESQAWSRIRKYQERGVTHLYIAREAYERSMMAIKLFREAIPARPAESSGNWSEIQIAHSLREISRLLSDRKTLEQIDTHVWEKGQELLYQFGRALSVDTRGSRGDQTSRWIRRCLFLDHTLSVFVLAALIGRPLQFTREENFMTLGTAAVFHDIALLDFENIPAEERAEGLTGEALKKFVAHPSEGARYLEEHFQADPIVIQAVQHHHWRRDGSGILPSGRQNPVFVPRLAEILGLAEECSYFLLREPQLTLSEIPKRLIPKMESKFSSEVLAGLQAALIPPTA